MCALSVHKNAFELTVLWSTSSGMQNIGRRAKNKQMANISNATTAKTTATTIATTTATTTTNTTTVTTIIITTITLTTATSQN